MVMTPLDIFNAISYGALGALAVWFFIRRHNASRFTPVEMVSNDGLYKVSLNSAGNMYLPAELMQKPGFKSMDFSHLSMNISKENEQKAVEAMKARIENYNLAVEMGYKPLIGLALSKK